MATNIGNTPIKSALLGSTELKRIYLGNSVVYSREFELLNSNTKRYLTEVNYSDSDYTNSYVANYRTSTITDLTHPLPASLVWSIGSNPYDSLKLYVSLQQDYSNSWIYELSSSANGYDVYNLIPNKTYYWKVVGLNNNVETVIKADTFTTTGLRRMFLIDGEHLGNFRDLGGLPCTGGFIKYGKLIRGAECLRDDGGPYMKINEAGIYELKNRIGVIVELDFGDLWQESPLEGKGFEVYRDHDLYGFYAYNRTDRGLESTIGRTCLHNCLELVIDKLSQNKNVYFHCNSGADRTGTFAFIIEALCGVSDDDKSKDYELTSFWATWYKEPYNRYTGFLNRFRNTPAEGNFGYNTMVEYILDTFIGNNLNECVYDMCITAISDGGLGLTSSQVAQLRGYLIESQS